MKRILWITVAPLLALVVASSATARETEHLLSVQEVVESERGVAHLLDLPFYFKGQPHPKILKPISQVTTKQSTRGAFRSDEASCAVALLSALRDLQEIAQNDGGNAITEIVSITRGKQTESATQFRCVAGEMVVHVGLKAKVVKIAPPKAEDAP